MFLILFLLIFLFLNIQIMWLYRQSYAESGNNPWATLIVQAL